LDSKKSPQGTGKRSSPNITPTTKISDLVSKRQHLLKPIIQRFSSRIRQPSNILVNPDYVIGRAVYVNDIHVEHMTPITYSEATIGQDKQKWMESMQTEIDALIRNDTWELVPYTEDLQIIGSKWVYRIKQNPGGSIEKYKSRLVAQ